MTPEQKTEYRKAVDRENQVRDAAFCDPMTEIGRGVFIRQMTPEDFIILDGLDSPILNGDMPHPAVLARDLFVLSPWYYRRNPVRWFARRRHAVRCRQFNFLNKPANIKGYLSAANQIRAYLDRTFQDSPGGTSVERVPFASWVAHLVNRIAESYGWPESIILKTSLRRLYQYLNCIRADNDPGAIFHNPSDKVRNAHNALRNQRVRLLNVIAKHARN